jgi:branched-chain amino acid transport system substrate-binding protein
VPPSPVALLSDWPDFFTLIGAAIVVIGGFGAAARADNTVSVGAIYPLAQSSDARFAIETVADIVNTPHPGLEKLPLGAGQGLPNLAGAKIAVTVADDLGNPSVAQAQALRLIAQNHVAALIGAGQSPETLAATALAERHGIPFLVPDATDLTMIGRGLNWVFRTTPLGSDVARAYMQFLAGLKSAGGKIDTIALVFRNTTRGAATAAAWQDAAKALGLSVASTIAYPPDGADLSVQVTALRGANPDVVIVNGDAADAGLLVRTMNTLGYKPPLLIGDDDGFSDPAFVAANGNLAQGVIDRSVWSLGKPDSPTAIVNELYKAKSGHDLDDTSARVMQGVFVLADAINRAGSTDPEAIRKALAATNIPSSALIMPWKGVKFDEAGQNTLGAGILVQIRDGKYSTVWPFDFASREVVWPMPKWDARK